MSTTLERIRSEALDLSEAERIRLAQSLWASVEDDVLPGLTDAKWEAEIQNRLKDQPDETWKSHEEVMVEARRRLGCGQ